MRSVSAIFTARVAGLGPFACRRITEVSGCSATALGSLGYLVESVSTLAHETPSTCRKKVANAYLHVTRILNIPHDLQKRPGHGSHAYALNIRIGARLIILAPGEHGHEFVLGLPILGEVLLAQPGTLLLIVAHVLQTLEERPCSCIQLLCLLHLIHVEATLDEVIRGGYEAEPFLDAVD